MKNLHLTADFESNKGKINVDLSIIQFEEEGCYFIYSPALDLTGYGKNSIEAKQSFDECLWEFFRYTTNKSTLIRALKELGWNVTGSKKKAKYLPPKDSEMISQNPIYSDIVNNKEFRREILPFAF
jgi:hypothetical protein